MPPRKNAASASGSTADSAKPSTAADVSMISNATTNEPTSPKAKRAKQPQQGDDMVIDDLLLPRSLISRISRGVLPPNTSIQKDAILALAKSATVFISHLAAEANDLTDRKTVQSQDVLKAIREIEMDGVMGLGTIGSDGRIGGRLEREVDMFEEVVRGKRRGYREKVKKSRESGAEKAEEGSTIATTRDEETEEQDRGHQNKKARREDNNESSREDAEMAGLANTSPKNTLDPRSNHKTNGSSLTNPPEDEGDLTETDPEMAEGNGDEDDTEEEDENDDEDQEDEEEDYDELAEDQLIEENNSQKKSQVRERLLAPDGTINDGSDDDDDSD